jgi:hypothetical protein
MPQFNLYHFNNNFSEHIQDDNLDGEESQAVLSLCQNMMILPSIFEKDAPSKEYENFFRGLALSSPWSKGGLRHLVPRILSDWNSKKRKE